MRTLLLAAVLTACGGSVETPATSAGGTDSATDDASTDTNTSTETGSCTGPAPGATCFGGGGPGRACGDVGFSMVCNGTAWACPAGTSTVCGCRAGPTGTGTAPLKPGDMCPDADAGPPPDAGSCDCIASKLAWQWHGGLVAYVDKSSIAPCRTYVFSRESPSGMAIKTCTDEVLKCGAGDAIDMGDIQAALSHVDVVNAFKKAPILYGRDTRPSDGQVFRVDYGGRVIEVGTDCGAISACTPIPDGVKKLQTILQALNASPPCTTM